MFGLVNQSLCCFIAQVVVNGPVTGINQGSDNDGDNKFVTVIEQRNCNDMRKWQLPRKSHGEHNKRVEELRAERGACGTEPEMLSGRELAEPVEQTDVGKLADEVRDEAPKDYPACRAKHARKRIIWNWRDGVCGDGECGLYKQEFKHNHGHPQQRDEPNTPFAEVLVHHVGNDERDRESDDPRRHYYAIELNTEEVQGER